MPTYGYNTDWDSMALLNSDESSHNDNSVTINWSDYYDCLIILTNYSSSKYNTPIERDDIFIRECLRACDIYTTYLWLKFENINPDLNSKEKTKKQKKITNIMNAISAFIKFLNVDG